MKTKAPLTTHKTLWKTLLAAIGILTTTAAQMQAIIIVGNSNPHDGFDSVLIGHFDPLNPSLSQSAAAGFTMPGQDYTLTDVLLRLRDYDGPNEAAVGIYLDNAGVPGSPFATLIDPVAVSAAATDYTFLPSGTVTLAANTKYWLVVGADPGSATAFFEWIGAFDSPMGVATFNGYVASQNGGATWRAAGGGDFNLRFTINGEPVGASVPDGGSTVLLLGTGLLAVVFASRRLRQGASAARVGFALR